VDPLEREFSFLAAAARTRIDDIHAAALRARAGAHERRGHAIAAHIVAVLEGLRTAINESSDGFDSAVSDTQKLAEIRELRVQNRRLNGIEEMRPWLEADHYAAPIYPGVVSFLEDACAAIVKAPADLVCYPATAYAYSSSTTPLRDYLEELELSEPEGPVPIVLDYPAQEAHGLFFHVLLLHELGHSADAVHDLYGQVVAKDPPDVARILDEAAERMADGNTAATRVRAEQIRRLRYFWLLELICDAIAFSYAGPAYLLGFAAFLLRYKDDLPTNRHPSTQLRLAFLLEQARAGGWGDMLTERMPLITEWLQDVSERKRTPVGHPFDDVEQALQVTRAEMWEIVDTHLGDGRCLPSSHESEIRRVQRLLPRRVLPVEHNGTPLDSRAILAGGWLAIAKPDELDPETLVQATANARSQGFLAKAIEMSILARVWASLDLAGKDK
jgi:hypothetical protein